MTITCNNCDTSISCNATSDFTHAFECPVCDKSLNHEFNQALNAALEYNKAAMTVIQYQRDAGVRFAT